MSGLTQLVSALSSVDISPVTTGARVTHSVSQAVSSLTLSQASPQCPDDHVSAVHGPWRVSYGGLSGARRQSDVVDHAGQTAQTEPG
jgi:hypothetical protein